MSLPAPNLDDRTFQEIVDDVKRQIGRRCPEWTDHNVSDPGVTLIELFAWMMEMTLFRLNQVPEKNYIKFLEMIGIALQPPTAARTDLRFLLARNIEDEDGEEAYERVLRARETVAATVRTENDPAIEFTTDVDLNFVRPRLGPILALPALPDDAIAADSITGLRLFNPDESLPIFSPTPMQGDALYIGFANDVSGNLIELMTQCIRSAATGLNEDYPSQRWEVWNGIDNVWARLENPRDTSFGFNRSLGQSRGGLPTGLIELALPAGMMPRQVGGRRAYWIRCVYTTDLPPRGAGRLRPGTYESAPEIIRLRARTIGGTAAASQGIVLRNVELGQSDGTPGQMFSLPHAPLLALGPNETLLTGLPEQPIESWQRWTMVDDFADSGEQDRHFICDTSAGEFRFGPNVPQSDGTLRQYGAVPPRGVTILLNSCRRGGGVIGNVAAGKIQVLKTSIPYIAEVYNPDRADGGREMETLEQAKMRARAMLRHRNRAVTVEDFEFLAKEASPAVGRARCILPRSPQTTDQNAETVPPGVVRVLLVPAVARTLAMPRPVDLRMSERDRQQVASYLDERRLLTAVLEIAEPEYLYVSTDITLVTDPKASAEEVVRAVRQQLETYLHPLRGGPRSTGWPFRRPLTLADIYAQIQACAGVAFLLETRLYISRLPFADADRLSPEEAVSVTDGIRPADNQLLCSREHRVQVRPLWAAEI
jgi:predicted phage baseplate assembly protein